MICKDRDIIHRCLLCTIFEGLIFFGSYIALRSLYVFACVTTSFPKFEFNQFILDEENHGVHR